MKLWARCTGRTHAHTSAQRKLSRTVPRAGRGATKARRPQRGTPPVSSWPLTQQAHIFELDRIRKGIFGRESDIDFAGGDGDGAGGGSGQRQPSKQQQQPSNQSQQQRRQEAAAAAAAEAVEHGFAPPEVRLQTPPPGRRTNGHKNKVQPPAAASATPIAPNVHLSADSSANDAAAASRTEAKRGGVQVQGGVAGLRRSGEEMAPAVLEVRAQALDQRVVEDRQQLWLQQQAAEVEAAKLAAARQVCNVASCCAYLA